MGGPRIPETASTLEGRLHSEAYDRMQATLRAKGWLETGELVRFGVAGRALEVGSGPGHLGLDWLLKTADSSLVGLDQSPDMVAIARQNTATLGLGGRAEYVLGSAEALPFPDGAFDAAFSSRSLHEWSDAAACLRELGRALKAGGRLFVSDLRRDVSDKGRRFLEERMTSELVLKGLRASLEAAYTVGEVRALLAGSALQAWMTVSETPLGLRLTGHKPP